MAIIDSGNNSAGKVNVDANYNLKVTLPTTDAYTGKARMMSENDDGLYISGTPYLKSPETSSDYRLRVGTDSLLFEDALNATTQNTNLWSYVFNTMTAAQPGAGTVNFSAVQGTTSAHGAYMRTFQYFPLVNTAPMAVEFYGGSFTSPLVAGEIFLMGLGIPGAATTKPTDGVWFRLSTAGLEGVIAYNNSETGPGVIFPFASISSDVIYKFTIVVGESGVEFWINDHLISDYPIPSGNPLPFINVSLPVFMMKYNTGAVSNTNTIRISRVGVSLMDIASNKGWSQSLSTMARSLYAGQNGNTMGSNSGNLVATAAIPGTQAGSNTAPNAAMAGLGGLFQMTNQASNPGASGTMVAQYYQNPASTINITGRNLVITGCRIDATNYGAASSGTATTLLWGVAYGHTSISLATAETASFATATTHSPRHVPLGMNYIPAGAVIGQAYSNPIIADFTASPIVVRPGEYLSATVRFLVGTATGSQTVVYTVLYTGYFE